MKLRNFAERNMHHGIVSLENYVHVHIHTQTHAHTNTHTHTNTHKNTHTQKHTHTSQEYVNWDKESHSLLPNDSFILVFFDPRLDHIGFVVDIVEMGQDLLLVLRVLPVTRVPPMLRTPI